ncbi:MAG: VOC family protein [Thaumarchaeota archaeon]|nr:VOC family protein [Nitrososphaerota archaeon]
MKTRFVYTGIRVKDIKKSIAFYSKVFGMKAVRRGKAPHGGIYVALRNPKSDQELELNWYPKTSMFYSSFTKGEALDHLAFAVGEGKIEQAFRELVSKGAKPAVSPEQAKGVTDVYVKDPDGNWIELLDWKV